MPLHGGGCIGGFGFGFGFGWLHAYVRFCLSLDPGGGHCLSIVIQIVSRNERWVDVVMVVLELMIQSGIAWCCKESWLEKRLCGLKYYEGGRVLNVC